MTDEFHLRLRDAVHGERTLLLGFPEGAGLPQAGHHAATLLRAVRHIGTGGLVGSGESIGNPRMFRSVAHCDCQWSGAGIRFMWFRRR
jgi:hypothetical protein